MIRKRTFALGSLILLGCLNPNSEIEKKVAMREGLMA